MKTKLLLGFTAVATAAASTFISAPAQAFMFGNNGISFTKDTDVTFTFSQSNGAYQSSLGIYSVSGSLATKVADLFAETAGSDNGSANGFLGTLGTTVLGPASVTFTFLANQVYSLGLSSTYKGKDAGTVYSTASLNRFGLQKAVFGSNGNAEGQAMDPTGNASVAPTFNPFFISFEDNVGKAVNGDQDFNDFTVTAQVPEPLTIGGLALGAAGLAAARRRRNRQSDAMS